ncbi:MAG: UDP-N-acetylmuramate dehydrogenase [Bacteroidales bacterium]|nr:UDP-N-acetylmuramate dehydrogenase [Bacteroidales bacterium]
MKRIENYDLSNQNTFRMKVKAALYIEYDNVEELQSLDLKALPQPVFQMGAGSNLLFTKDFPGTILHSNIKFIKYVDMGLDEVLLTVGSGVVFDDLIANVAGNGLWGMENLSLIPGEVGASAVQNIGAYGVEAKDVISGVVCLDTKDWTKTVFKVGECAYGYRDSRFKHERGRYIITSVLFRVTRKYCPKLDYGGVRAALEGRDLQALTPMDVREAIIGIRNAKLPDPAQIGSAGSFFKNPVISREHFERIVAAECPPSAPGKGPVPCPEKGGPDTGIARPQNAHADIPHFDLPDGTVKVPAAWLIDQCGFRGKILGGAQVYEKQPLVIVNASGSASPEDVLALENQILAKVKEKYDIDLHPEVDHI